MPSTRIYLSELFHSCPWGVGEQALVISARSQAEGSLRRQLMPSWTTGLLAKVLFLLSCVAPVRFQHVSGVRFWQCSDILHLASVPLGAHGFVQTHTKKNWCYLGAALFIFLCVWGEVRSLRKAGLKGRNRANSNTGGPHRTSHIVKSVNQRFSGHPYHITLFTRPRNQLFEVILKHSAELQPDISQNRVPENTRDLFTRTSLGMGVCSAHSGHFMAYNIRRFLVFRVLSFFCLAALKYRSRAVNDFLQPPPNRLAELT